MRLVSLISLAISCSLSAAVPFKRSNTPGFDYDNQKVRGVNIGGWLVIEPFITPSLFQAFGDESQTPIDEYHYTQYLGKEEAASRLKAHWDSWFTQQDFVDIAKSYNLNHVRIPIGYWAFTALPQDPYVQGQEEYLDRAIGWARDAGLKVWIDLHGAPGSQNGFDNSGLRDSWEWQNGNNTAITLGVLQYMANKYGSEEYNDVVTAIELLNEPLGPVLDMGQVKQYYYQGYDMVRSASTSRGVVFHDAFMPLNYWNDFMPMPDHYFTILDHHHYQVFSPAEVSKSIDDHVAVACDLGRQTQSEPRWRVVGEWSAALTDCAKWLNGVGKGPRYTGAFPGSWYVGSCDNRDDESSWSQDQINNSRRFVEAQMEAYDQGNGWIFWCYKTETALEWDFRRLVKTGVIPFPYENRQYPNTCGFNN